MEESFEREGVKVPEHEDIQIRAVLYEDNVFDRVQQDQDRCALLLRPFLAWKKLKDVNYYEERIGSVRGKLEERDKLGKKMVALTDVERKFKDDIHGTQRYIAKLEIKNNLLRKEIHNSQFERIKLLKQVNEIKNKIDEVTWFVDSMRKAV